MTLYNVETTSLMTLSKLLLRFSQCCIMYDVVVTHQVVRLKTFFCVLLWKGLQIKCKYLYTTFVRIYLLFACCDNEPV